MTTWNLSHYTVILKCESGDVLFHNSFMGAIARIPEGKFSTIEHLINQEITEELLSNETLNELCRNGFFFPNHLDEREFVTKVLQKENNSSNFDLILLPHENCNFRCNYCYETHSRGIMKPEVVQGLKSFIAQKVTECKSLNVRWFGGEPLLAKDLIYELSDFFMQCCDAKQIPYRSHMTTNAYLLTPEVARQLLKRNVTNYQVTFDGPETTHDTTRTLIGGGKTFKTIFNNLLEMKQLESDFSVSIRVNFNDESLPVMEEFFQELSEAFGTDSRFGLYFRPIGKYGGPNDDNLQVCEPRFAKIMEMELTEKFLQYGYLDQVVRKSLQSHGQVCYAGKESSMVIGSDGTIYKCSVAFEDPQNQVGKLLEDGSLNIDQTRWNSWVSNQNTDNSKCNSCPVIPLCQGKYCPRYSIREKKPICPMTPTGYMHLVQLASNSDSKLL